MRLYNGCPDDELRAVLDDQALAERQLAAIGARATYFPVEESWMVFQGHKAITGFHPTKRAAANAALKG